MPFRSKAQQRYAFATGQPWARRWAEETGDFADLPERARRMAEKKRARSATKADAPALPEERIVGSRRNPAGSAASAGSGRDIEITAAVETGLRNKMREHNAAHDEDGKRATMGMLRSVWRRGAGAFSTSHRPGMTRQQWAMARVNAFLHLLAKGKPETAAYVTDNDLLPEGHPRSTRRATKAQVRFASYQENLDKAMGKKKPKGGGGGGSGILERIAGELCRARDGRYVSCGSPEATPESKRELRKKERKMERAKEQADNIAKVADGIGVDREEFGALMAFGDKDNPKALSSGAQQSLVAQGLVEIGDDGAPRLSSSGRALIAAARGGDAARARDALSVGRERAKRAADAAAAAEEAASKPKEEKPKKGGGGGKKQDKAAQSAQQKREIAIELLKAFRDGDLLTINERRFLETMGLIERVDGRVRILPAGRNALRTGAIKAADSFEPPAAVRDAARRALEVRAAAAPSNRGMTFVGLARARDLMNGRPVSMDTLRRMKAYFDRHEVDKQGSTWDERGKGWQAWMGWGGDAGRAWAERMLRQAEPEVKTEWDDLDLLELEIAIKHGKHNQMTHGRRGAGGIAYMNAYRAARQAGVDPYSARMEGREARAEVRWQQKQAKLAALKERATHLRKLIDDGKLTDYQAQQAIMRAENLEARARGERVPHPRMSADQDITRPSRAVRKDAEALRREIDGKSPEEAARIVQQHLQQRITPGNIQLELRAGVESTAEGWARAEVAALQSMIDRKAVNPNPIELSGGARRANYNDGLMKTAVSNSGIRSQIKAATPEQLATVRDIAPLTRAGEVGWRRTFAHEYGHHLDENPIVMRSTQAFLRRRTIGESERSLRRLTGLPYGSDEYTRKDKFIDPYVGKIYPYGMKASEILSMGLEWMRANPAEFARRDRDHFDFVYKILRGDL